MTACLCAQGITVSVDNSSSFTPTQIVNGDFSTQPYMPFKYNDTWYNEMTGNSPGYDVYWSEIKPNGVGGGWNTTETQIYAHGEFEWVNGMSVYNPTLADNGKNEGHGYFIEMNACNSAVLYQDLATHDHDVIRWSLQHAVRTGDGWADPQSMRVEIGAPQRDGSNNIVAASGVNEAVDAKIIASTKATYNASGYSGYNGYAGDYSGLSLPKSYSSQWYTVTGVYSIPQGQDVTRFAFISTNTTTPGGGNLLDNITFSTLIGNLSARQLVNDDVEVKGYWGETDSSKKLKVVIGSTTHSISMTSVTERNFVMIIPSTTIGSETSVEVYHEDYESAGRTIVVYRPFEGIGTENDPFLISSADDWDRLAELVNGGKNYAGKYFRQTADFTITNMVGTIEKVDNNEVFHTFDGIYDGDGHTLTLNLNVANARCVGPFRCVIGATIRNLIVSGSVTVSGSSAEASRHPSALIGITREGNVLIENCHVSANVSGADYMGGLIGHSWHANITIRGCVYSGTLTAAGTQYAGGLIGWGGDGGGMTFSISNCLFAGAYSGNGNFHPIGVVNTSGNTRSLANTYYTAGLNNMTDNHDHAYAYGLSYKGKYAYRVTGASGATVENAAASTTYSVSGITSYGTGIAYGGVLYAGEGEAISVNLSGSSNYKLSAGTLSGSTLTMPASNVTIYGAAQFATTPSAKELTYSGTAQELVNAGSTNDGTIEYKLDNGTWSPTIPSQTNYGTYTVSYHIVGDATHADNPGSSVSVTINKAALSITADNKSITYGDAAPTYTATYSGWQGSDNTSALSGTLTFACDYSAGSNVGNYTITPSGVTASNYDITFVPGTLTVNKADAAVATLPAAVEGLAYTGSAQALISAGTATGGEMLYKLDNGEYSTALPTATDVRVYTVYYKVVGDANHNDVEEASLEVTIGKPTPTITANADPQHPGTYYSTFYYGLFNYIIPANVEAYAATIGESDLYLKKIAGAGDVLPEGTAVILKSTEPGYTMEPTDDEAITITEANDLRGVDVPTEVSDLGISGTCYVLSGRSADHTVSGVGFYTYSGTLGAHKAYVVVGNNAPKRMRFVFDTETDIERVEQPYMAVKKYIENGMLIIEKNGVRYNIQGQIIK